MCKENIVVETKIKSQSDNIKFFMSRNGYPLQTCNSIIKRLRNNTNTRRNGDKNDAKKIRKVRLSYLGHIGGEMKKKHSKIVQIAQKCLTGNVCFF